MLMPLKKLRVMVIAILCCCAIPASAGLFSKKPAEPKLVVPVCPTAKEQYGYAVVYQKTQMLVAEKKKRKEQLSKIIQCYEAVIRNFPDDQTNTPLAYLEIADCHGLDGDDKGAISLYQDAMRRYSDLEYVQARGLLAIARSYDRSGDYVKAKEVYREVMTRYGQSTNNIIRGFAKRAQTCYYLLKEQSSEKGPKKPKP